MYEGKGPLAEELEKFFRGSNIPYKIRAMGPASVVMGRDYGSFLRASEDFAVLSDGEFIPDNNIEKIREEARLHYIGEGMLLLGPGKKDMYFSDNKKKVVVNMTPFEREIRITVFEERGPKENYIEAPETQTFKM